MIKSWVQCLVILGVAGCEPTTADSNHPTSNSQKSGKYGSVEVVTDCDTVPR